VTPRRYRNKCGSARSSPCPSCTAWGSSSNKFRRNRALRSTYSRTIACTSSDMVRRTGRGKARRRSTPARLSERTYNRPHRRSSGNWSSSCMPSDIGWVEDRPTDCRWSSRRRPRCNRRRRDRRSDRRRRARTASGHSAPGSSRRTLARGPCRTSSRSCSIAGTCSPAGKCFRPIRSDSRAHRCSSDSPYPDCNSWRMRSRIFLGRRRRRRPRCCHRRCWSNSRRPMRSRPQRQAPAHKPPSP
jgi:hypothetical protein